MARVGWEEVEATDTAIHANAQEALEPASAPSEGEGEGVGVGDDGGMDPPCVHVHGNGRHDTAMSSAVILIVGDTLSHAMHKLDYRWA